MNPTLIHHEQQLGKLRMAPSTPGRDRRRSVISASTGASGSPREYPQRNNYHKILRNTKLRKTHSHDDVGFPATTTIQRKASILRPSIMKQQQQQQQQSSGRRWSDSVDASQVPVEILKAELYPPHHPVRDDYSPKSLQTPRGQQQRRRRHASFDETLPRSRHTRMLLSSPPRVPCLMVDTNNNNNNTTTTMMKKSSLPTMIEVQKHNDDDDNKCCDWHEDLTDDCTDSSDVLVGPLVEIE